MEKISLDKSSKELLEKTSALFGVKSDIVKEVWEYTLFTWLLSLSESDKKLKQIHIPFLGTIGIRFNNNEINNETDKIDSNFDVFVAVNDSFKEMLQNVENNATTELAEFLQNKIKKIISQIN